MLHENTGWSNKGRICYFCSKLLFVMAYIYSLLSQIPMRRMPDERAEMVNQLLYGEAFELLHRETHWLFIRCLFDGYEGWITSWPSDPSNRFSEEPPPLATHLIVNPLAEVHDSTGNSFRLSFGSELRENLHYRNEDVIANPFTHPLSMREKTDLLMSFATKLLWTPYLWGGRTSLGMDCSGFIQLIHKVAGITLPRDAWQQAEHGQTIDFLQEAEVGDLVFFDNEEGKISHVGILTDNKTVIHASGYVKTDRIDHHGIFNVSQKRYTHKLRIIKRLSL